MMNTLLVVASAAIAGMGYVALCMAIGSKVIMLLWRRTLERTEGWQVLVALFLGVLVHCIGVALTLAVRPSATGYVLWALLAYVVFDWRRTISFARVSKSSFLMIAAYGLVCYGVLLAFNFGAMPGDNLFWSIYKLTHVTPGDSPQGLFQAQYLLYGGGLKGAGAFSLFDRPFFGGLITLGVMSALGFRLGQSFEVYSSIQIYAYVALWIWLNSGIVLAINSLLGLLRKDRSIFLVQTIILVSPFVVFNVIGLWPKLFALYVIYCAAYLAINGYYKSAVVLSGFSFLIHGSFLWPHLSFSGILAIYLLHRERGSVRRIGGAVKCAVIGLAFPVSWFGAQKLLGFASPLALYYLYAAPVGGGVEGAKNLIVKSFYQSSSPSNISVLPFINLIKGIIPVEIIRWIVGFSLFGPSVSFREVSGILFQNQFYRPLFGLGLVGGGVALFGLRRELITNKWLSMSMSVFWLVPLLPGILIYRNDDLFISPIMMFSLIPLWCAFSMGVRHMARYLRMTVSLLMIFEFWLIYWYRYTGVHYYHEFYNYYGVAILIIIMGALSRVIYCFWNDRVGGVSSAQLSVHVNDE